jgi:hypothetical protein
MPSAINVSVGKLNEIFKLTFEAKRQSRIVQRITIT